MSDSARAARSPSAGGRLGPWIAALRARFLVVAVVPVAAGFLVALRVASLEPLTAALTLLGSAVLLFGTNLVDEYFDYVQHRGSEPFEGGSGMLAAGRLDPDAMLAAGQACFAAAGVIGLYLAWVSGWLIAAFTAFALFAGYYYVAPPVRFGYRGFGELICGLAMGPTLLLGTVYIQLQELPLLAWTASVPIALCVAFVLYGNSIPDIEQDRRNHKWTLALRLGRTASIYGYFVWMAAALAANAVLAAFDLLPPTMWLTLVFVLPWLRLLPRAGGPALDGAYVRTLARLGLVFYALNGVALLAGLALWVAV